MGIGRTLIPVGHSTALLEGVKVKELSQFEIYLSALNAGDINADTFAELTVNLERGAK
jgi:hypothetical protein